MAALAGARLGSLLTASSCSSMRMFARAARGAAAARGAYRASRGALAWRRRSNDIAYNIVAAAATPRYISAVLGENGVTHCAAAAAGGGGWRRVLRR